MPWSRDRFHFDRFSSLLGDPLDTLRTTYLPGDMASAEHAHSAAARLFPLLQALSRSLQLSWQSDQVRVASDPAPPSDSNPDDVEHDHEDAALELPDSGPLDISASYRDYCPRFMVFLPGESAEGEATSRVGLVVTASSAEHPSGIRGFIVSFAGEVGWSETYGEWRLELTAGGAIPAFVIGPDGIDFAPSESPLTGGTAAFVIERVSDPGAPAFRLGATDGPRIEIGTVRFRTDLELSATRQALSLAVEAASGALILAAGDGDGFLGTILPPDGVRVALDLGLILSSDRGFELKGGAGMNLTLQPNLKLGPVAVPSLQLALEAYEGDDVRFTATGALSVRLGPLVAVVEGLGVRLTASAPPTGGSFGPVDLDAAFQPPKGVGLTLDSGLVAGGGYLEFDSDKQQYAGIVQLQFEKLALTAIGLLTTRMPDGSSGFSLLLIIAVDDFQPIELGLGFKLTGVGGLLGYNRTVAVEVLRSGLKNRTLDRVLFPNDPMANAPAIISTLRSVFPPTPDQFVIGPIAQISWGKEGLLTANIGLALEFPDPIRLVLLGQLKALFPSRQAPLVRLNMDLLGVIDFDKGEALVLATLFDSVFYQFTVTGDAAFYLRWKRHPTFILSVGGFHPAYPSPPELPSLDRLGLMLSKGTRIQLRLTWYLALTSNTLQHGARIDLRLKASKFRLDGHLSYDALIQFDPFRFMVLFSAGVGLKWGSRTLAAVLLEGTLSGPSPWHIRGKAKFKIRIFSKSVSFDRTLGSGRTAPPLPVVDPKPALLSALQAPENWQASLPPERDLLVTLKDQVHPTGLVKVHPLGSMQVRQQVLPLKTKIEQFGNSKTAQSATYALGREDGSSDSLEDLQAYFAPAQYKHLSQRDKLREPSFVSMPAGVSLGGSESATYGSQEQMRTLEMGYETELVLSSVSDGEAKSVSQESLSPLDGSDLLVQAQLGASGKRRRSQVGMARFESVVEYVPEELEATPYVIVNQDDLGIEELEPVSSLTPSMSESGASYHEALELLKEYEQLHPKRSSHLQVVPLYEVK